MAQPLKLATPELSVTMRPPELVQLSTPPPGCVPLAGVTARPEPPVSVLPFWSRPATETAKLPVPLAWMFWPADGWVVKLSWLAVPAVMLNAFAFDGAASDTADAVSG